MTAIALAPKDIFAGSAAQTTVLDLDQNPRSVRWGYGAGLCNMAVSPRETGIQLGVIQQGIFQAFIGASYPVDAASLEGDRSVMYELTPLDAINKVIADYGSQDSKKGFGELKALVGVTDGNLIAAVEFIVNPPFDILGWECPEGLSVCPTCRKDLLRDVPKRIEAYAGEFGVSADLCHRVYEDVKRINQMLIDFYSKEWASIKGEYETAAKGGTGMRTLQAEHLYVRACLHESAPEEKQAQIVTAYGSQLGEAFSTSLTALQQQNIDAQRQNAEIIAQAMKASQSSPEMIQLLAQMQEDNRRRDERDAQRDQLLFNLVQSITQNPNPPVVTENKGVKK